MLSLGLRFLLKKKNKMKKKVQKILKRKEKLLIEVQSLQETEKNKSKLKDIDKNEIELRAQINVLRFLIN